MSMNDSVLQKCFCGQPITCQCGRCKKISYCGRECQIKDWQIHKLSCSAQSKTTSDYDKLLQQVKDNYANIVLDKLSGTLLIMESYRRKLKKHSHIVVTITENINDFCKPNQFHFGHISCAGNSFRCDDKKSMNILVAFNDYSHFSKLSVDDHKLNNLKNLYPDPGKDWSVFFTV